VRFDFVAVSHYVLNHVEDKRVEKHDEVFNCGLWFLCGLWFERGRGYFWGQK